jgi:sucrose-6-phosphate hydrolase SacC (GH32 family)
MRREAVFTLIEVWIALAMLSICGAVAAGSDKTLVSWVCLANATQQGGSALTIQCGDQFDGIVFGEREAGKWMAGSDYFARTQGNQQANAAEKADSKTLIQIAIVYNGNQISIYRNGETYASYEATNLDLLSPMDNMAVFGLRHCGAMSGQMLQGSIEDARIYDRALSADELKKLEPNKESAMKPYAWWTFEKGKETDLMGRFPINNLSGGAKIEEGRLMLETGAAALIAAAKKTAGDSAVEFETPAMPANPPDDWLAYHLLHPGPGGAMPGDPNCAFYWKGRYHLHYIYNHKDGFAFAHVSSKDLVHWTWHPTTLFPKVTGHGMFSGTGFITKEGKPAIIYHGEGSGRNQLAFARDDKLEKWSKPVPIVPKDASGGEPAFNNWDPDCWLKGDTYYAISGGGNPSLMKSSDLKDWRFLGPLLHDDYPANLGIPKGEDISCANMFKIGNKWMLLCISHGLGCRYYLGDFRDEKYLPEFQAMMSWNGNNFFAPESVLTKDGRRVMWAWLLKLPVAPCGVQSLPRELELPEDGVLRIRPLRELQALRTDGKQEAGITVKSDAVHLLKQISGNTLELEVVFQSPTAKEFGLDVLCDKNGENGVRVAVLADSKTLRVGPVNAPFELKMGEDLTLRIFIDKNLVEVFANDRQAAVSAGKYVPENLAVSLFSRGGDIAVKQIKCWKMKSTYAVPLGAAEERVVFEDRFDGKLAGGWTWLRENRKAWRLADSALEIRVEPGLADTVKNALVRKAPDRTKGKAAIDVTVTFTAPPTNQFEQAGLTWYRDGQPVFKLVHEQIDGTTYIIPGRIAAPEKTVQLRLVVTADQFTAQFRPDAKGEFKTVASGALAPGANEEISLQCYNGPADAEHWIRFDDFRIVQLSE